MTVDGVTRHASSAIATVTGFMVEPGSKVSLRATTALAYSVPEAGLATAIKASPQMAGLHCICQCISRVTSDE